MEPKRALARLLQQKGPISALLFEAGVLLNDAYPILNNALVDLQEHEWKNDETTDRLLLESIDRQCREYAQEVRRPYQGLRREMRNRPKSWSESGELCGRRYA